MIAPNVVISLSNRSKKQKQKQQKKQQQRASNFQKLQSFELESNLHGIDTPKISWDEVTVGECLGAGSFCSVYQVTVRSKVCALKCLKTNDNKNGNNKNNKTYNINLKIKNAQFKKKNKMYGSSICEGSIDLGNEAKILASLNHPNIIRLYAVSKEMLSESFCCMDVSNHSRTSIKSSKSTGKNQNESKNFRGYFLLLEKLSTTLNDEISKWRKQLQHQKTSKRKYIPSFRFSKSATSTNNKTMKKNGGDDDDDDPQSMKSSDGLFQLQLDVAHQIVDGMIYLHGSKNCILMRDLKPHNIGMTDNGTIRIFDFGFSRYETNDDMQDLSDCAGTLGYMAKEVAMGQPFTKAADVFSFGVILYELLFLQHPFARYLKSKEKKHYMEMVIEQNWRPEINHLPHVELQQIIQSCWDPQPNNRPSFVQIKGILNQVCHDVLQQQQQLEVN